MTVSMPVSRSPQRPIVLTLSNGQAASRYVWNGRKPFKLGHSRQWTIERLGPHVRLRAAREGAEAKSFLFHDSELEQGARLKLDGFSLELRNSATLPAAHAPEEAATEEAATEGAAANPGRFRVYRRARGWTLESGDLGEKYTARLEDVPVFWLARNGAEYWLTSVCSEPLRVFKGKTVHELRPSQVLVLNARELAELSVRAGAFDWSFNRPAEVALPVAPARPDPEWIDFRKNLSAAGTLVAALVFTCFLIPRGHAPLETEVIPMQQITITPPPQLRAAAMGSGATKKAAAPKLARDSVAPAFQDNKLQSAMKGLFRGGMTQLLAKSEFGPGADRSDNARKLFNTSSPGLHSTAPLTGPGIGRGTSVRTLGGGDGQGSGKGVGYGSGEHANVQGQGKSLVAMDTSGSSVEEGLTREEVGKVIHQHLAEVRYCYEASIIRSPDLAGKLVLGFTINGAGRVKGAQVRGSTLSDSQLDDCIMRRLIAWKFPSTKGGIDVAVTYPFIFKTLGG